MNKSFKSRVSYPLSLIMIIISLTAFTSGDHGAYVKKSIIHIEDSTRQNIREQLSLHDTSVLNIKFGRTNNLFARSTALSELNSNYELSAITSNYSKKKSKINFSFLNTGKHASSQAIINKHRNVDDGVIKILAIGNSFSQDAIENYLHELAMAENIPMIIGNLYIGGASLQKHWKNARNNIDAYSYRKIVKNGTKTRIPNTSIATAVADENWDFISFQQVSGNSGEYETFIAPLPALLEYVRQQSRNPHTKYILHQTWAYAKKSTHNDFPKYKSDQEYMYEIVVNTVRKARTNFDLDFLVPSGTAIQNGRNTVLGDVFTRDGYHLDKGIGRYTAACTWFEALTSTSVVGNTFKPSLLTDLEAIIAQYSAHSAIRNPDMVTQFSN